MRELFLVLCREDPPEGYADEGFCLEWERRRRPELSRHLEFGRRRHQRTESREWGGD